MEIQRKSRDADLEGVIAAWGSLRKEIGLSPIRSQREYVAACKLLDRITDAVGERADHPLADLMELIATLIERYEDQHMELPEANPVDVLSYLMEQHELKQSDLKKEIGSQGVVSEILQGKRSINARQAKALAKRFNVSPAVFL